MNYDIGILGGGESGVGAALLANAKGLNPFVSDIGELTSEFLHELKDAGIDYEEHGHSIDILSQCKEIIKSPGIPSTTAVISKLAKSGLKIISEIELASRYIPPAAKLIGITGSNGKTTTTNLTYHILQSAGLSVAKGGNLGTSLARLLLEEPYDYYVIEISSFQLDDIESFRPDIAVLLNITPDHLDRYRHDFELYADAKIKIGEHQKAPDLFIYNGDDPSIVARLSGLHARLLSIDGSNDVPIKNPYLRGAHNRFNAAVSRAIAIHIGIEMETIDKAMLTFVNDNHRMQPVREICGVSWINDSKATNVDAVSFALRAIEGNIIWIVGGVDKGNDYSVLLHMVQDKVKSIISLGLDNTLIINAFAGIKEVHSVDTMVKAVTLSHSLAQREDTVLLSPACASFDLFNNYKDRGQQFIECVRGLPNTVSIEL